MTIGRKRKDQLREDSAQGPRCEPLASNNTTEPDAPHPDETEEEQQRPTTRQIVAIRVSAVCDAALDAAHVVDVNVPVFSPDCITLPWAGVLAEKYFKVLWGNKA